MTKQQPKLNNKQHKTASAAEPREFDTSVAAESVDSLQIYMRQIAENELLTQEEQFAVLAKIDTAIENFRQALYQFSFILSEHLKLLDTNINRNIPANFLPSIIKEKQIDDGSLSEWREQIIAIEHEIRQAGSNDCQNLASIRCRIATLLTEYPVVYDRLQEWYEVIRQHIPFLKAIIDHRVFS